MEGKGGLLCIFPGAAKGGPLIKGPCAPDGGDVGPEVIGDGPEKGLAPAGGWENRGADGLPDAIPSCCMDCWAFTGGGKAEGGGPGREAPGYDGGGGIGPAKGAEGICDGGANCGGGLGADDGGPVGRVICKFCIFSARVFGGLW